MPHKPHHGHHEPTQMDRIEKSQGRVEKSQGRDEGRTMEALARLKELEQDMADLSTQLTDIKTTLVDGTTKLGTDLDILIAAFKAAPGTISPEQQLLLDGVLGIGATLKAADEKILAAVAVEPPIDPVNPTARRR